VTGIVASTRAYEDWLGEQVGVVQADLGRKHDLMASGFFPFLRGTFYRWAERFPRVCPDLMGAPVVEGVGDAHIENFGTWRDAEGRLVWGVNDFDEEAGMPYPNDLVRVAASVAVAARDVKLAVDLSAVCSDVLAGYRAALVGGGEPFVLSERHVWLAGLADVARKDPPTFWAKLLGLATVDPGDVDTGAHSALLGALPAGVGACSFHRRVAGVGSLGRPRFVVIAGWNGGWVAREAKAVAPSSWGDRATSPPVSYDLLARAVRSRDPFVVVHDGWLVRRLAPDCTRVDLGDQPKARQEGRLLRAMGAELANVHLGTRHAVGVVADDLARRAEPWLMDAVSAMVADSADDWRAWSHHRAR